MNVELNIFRYKTCQKSNQNWALMTGNRLNNRLSWESTKDCLMSNQSLVNNCLKCDSYGFDIDLSNRPCIV